MVRMKIFIHLIDLQIFFCSLFSQTKLLCCIVLDVHVLKLCYVEVKVKPEHTKPHTDSEGEGVVVETHTSTEKR